MKELVRYLLENIYIDFQGDIDLEQVRDFLRKDDSHESRVLLQKLNQEGSIDDLLLSLADVLKSFIPKGITDQVLREKYPEVRIINFGHLGDGNLHYNVAAPAGVDSTIFNAANEALVHDIIYSMVEKFGGSISAEHGIGQLKMRDLRAHKGAIAHDLMQVIKTALDPHNILNPNKVLPAKAN